VRPSISLHLTEPHSGKQHLAIASWYLLWMAAAPYSGPPFGTIRKNLTDLVTLGLSPYGVAEKGQALMELQIVLDRRTKLSADADDDVRDVADADALVTLLGEAVERKRIPNRRYRRVLRYMLPLYTIPGYEQYRGTSLEDRRDAAAQNLTGEQNGKTVEPSTIRTYYEPRALNQLAVVLIMLEAEHRGEEPPASLPRVQ
jgi:hypothetical protein